MFITKLSVNSYVNSTSVSKHHGNHPVFHRSYIFGTILSQEYPNFSIEWCKQSSLGWKDKEELILNIVCMKRHEQNLSYKFFFFSPVPCGGTYNATWTPQSISSPNSSDPEIPFSTCTWVLEAPPHQQVKITVWALQLHPQDCDQNYLEFQDSPEVIIIGCRTVTSSGLFTSIYETLEVMKA